MVNWRGMGWGYATPIVVQMKKKDEKIKYKSFSIRLHEGTKQKLIEAQQKSNLSWNRFIYKLLEEKSKG